MSQDSDRIGNEELDEEERGSGECGVSGTSTVEFALPSETPGAGSLMLSESGPLRYRNCMTKETGNKLSSINRGTLSQSFPQASSKLVGSSPNSSSYSNNNEFGLPGKICLSRSSALPSVPTPSFENSDGAAVSPPIPDDLFVSDILFMWLGVKRTLYIEYDERMERYYLLQHKGSVGQQHAVEVFQPCGVLAHRIHETLRRPTATVSYLQQSLRSALRRQFTQYHSLIAALRQQQQRCGDCYPSLTLGELTVVSNRVLPKLWAMNNILRETESVKGGEFASKLQQLIQQGSSRLSELLAEIYFEAIGPLLDLTVSSITEGDVADPFSEFFILVNPKIELTSDTYWACRFYLSASMLPDSVLPRHVAEDILLVTKNICFIKHCCRSKEWSMHPSIVAEARQATFETIPEVVQQALAYSNAAVLHLLYDQHKLDEAFKVINAFLLVGYGDFFEILIQKLEPILSKLSSSIQVSLVREQVESALLEVVPSAKHFDRLSSLHCEVIKDDGKIGWDAFVLTMSFGSPLNNLFGGATMKVYKRLFRVMFRVKVAEVSLKAAWRHSVHLDRLMGGLYLRAPSGVEIRAWREVAADAHLLGLQLNHFVMNLWSYLVSEVSTVAGDLLNKALARCQSFDDLRVAHNTYLAYLIQRSLLHHDCANIRINIENLLTIVREYRSSQALLTSLIERGCEELSSIKYQYQNLADEFHRSMSSLLTTLEEQHIQYDYLNFLLLRLNFNRFYHDTDTGGNTEF